ncbi:MAG: zinc-dependent metalloprotease [Acidimicrobiia bacterium]
MTAAAALSDTSGATPEPVDWALAIRVATRVAGHDRLSRSYLGASLIDDFEAVTAQAAALVTEHTRLRVVGDARGAVLSRQDWVEANVRSMRNLLGPITNRVGARMASSPLAPVGRAVSATELGLLLGWFAQRVLGQYDVLVPDGETTADGDAVYYVGPNVLALEKRFAFRPRDFRLWIAIHEVTHRAQFLGVPWMREYFLGLVHGVLGSVDADPRKIVAALLRAAEELRNGRNPLDDGGIVALIATPEHRGALAKVQALMSVLEGHGNRVMNELGRAHVSGQDRMARVLQTRRRSQGVTGLLSRLLGIDSKMRQYEVGEAFVEAVEREAGPRGLDPVWQRSENLPTLAELDAPTAWLARVERGDAAPAA